MKKKINLWHQQKCGNVLHLTGFIAKQCIFSTLSCLHFSFCLSVRIIFFFPFQNFSEKKTIHTHTHKIYLLLWNYIRFTMKFDLHKMWSRAFRINTRYSRIWGQNIKFNGNKLFLSKKYCAHCQIWDWLEAIPFGRSETIHHIIGMICMKLKRNFRDDHKHEIVVRLVVNVIYEFSYYIALPV